MIFFSRSSTCPHTHTLKGGERASERERARPKERARARAKARARARERERERETYIHREVLVGLDQHRGGAGVLDGGGQGGEGETVRDHLVAVLNTEGKQGEVDLHRQTAAQRGIRTAGGQKVCRRF